MPCGMWRLQPNLPGFSFALPLSLYYVQSRAHEGGLLGFGVKPLTRFCESNRMKMYPDDWPVRLTNGAFVAACLIAAWLLGIGRPEDGFWPFMLSIVVAIIVGNVLGGLVGRRLFPPSSGAPPEDRKGAR